MKPVYKILTVVPAMALGALVVLLTPSIIADNSLGNEAQHGDDACSQPTDPRYPKSTIDARRAEAESMLGSMRNQIRAEYAKTATPPKSYKDCGIEESERNGEFFEVENVISNYKYESDGERIDCATIFATPTTGNEDCGRCSMCFIYNWGTSRIRWDASTPKIVGYTAIDRIQTDAKQSLNLFRNFARAQYATNNLEPKKLTDCEGVDKSSLETEYLKIQNAITTTDAKATITATVKSPYEKYATISLTFEWATGKSEYDWGKIGDVERDPIDVKRNTAVHMLVNIRNALRHYYFNRFDLDEDWKRGLTLKAHAKDIEAFWPDGFALSNDDFEFKDRVGRGIKGMGILTIQPRDPKNKKLGTATMVFDWTQPEYTIKWDTE